MVLHAIQSFALTAPSRLALIGNQRQYTYREFWEAILQAEQFLRAQGIAPGARVGLAVQDLGLAWLLILALEKMGHPASALPPSTDANTLNLRNTAAWISDGRQGMSWTEPTVFVDQSLGLQIPSGMPVADPFREPEHRELFVIYSSGTTGAYKKVAMTRDMRQRRLDSSNQLHENTPDTRKLVGAFGPWTTYGYSGPLGCWSSGAAVIFNQAQDFAHTLAQHRPTSTFMTPGIALNFLAKLPMDHPRHDDLRVSIGGGPLTRGLTEALRARLTHNIVHSYGSSENGGVARTKISIDTALDWHELLPSVDVEIVDEGHHALPIGANGRIRIKTPWSVSSYLDDEEATRASFKDGWFYPGDLGTLDAARRLRIAGRDSEVINYLGDKVSPQRIEDTVKSRIDCRHVAAFSAPLGEGGEALHIVLETDQRPSRDELAHAIATVQSAFQRVLIHHIDELPRTHTGKVQYGVLRERFAGAG